MSTSFTCYHAFQEDGSIRIYGSLFYSEHILASINSKDAMLAVVKNGPELGFSIVVPAVRGREPVKAPAGKSKKARK